MSERDKKLFAILIVLAVGLSILLTVRKGKQVSPASKRITMPAAKRIAVGTDGTANYYSELPDTKRKLIYRHMITLEDQGVTDLDENYRQTAKKFSITVEQARSISIEGTMKRWPQP